MHDPTFSSRVAAGNAPGDGPLRSFPCGDIWLPAAEWSAWSVRGGTGAAIRHSHTTISTEPSQPESRTARVMPPCCQSMSISRTVLHS